MIKICSKLLGLASVCFLMCGGCVTTNNRVSRIQAKTHYDIAIATFNNGDERGALSELMISLKLDPELPEAHNAIGLVYHSLNHLEDGLAHYEKAVGLRPQFSEAYNNMGILLIDLVRYDDAIKAFEVAVGDILYRTPWIAEGNMGWAFYKRGDFAKGIGHIRNALATNPKFCRGYEWLVRIALALDNPDEVIKNYGRFERYCEADRELVRGIRTDYLRQMKYYYALGLLKRGEQGHARQVLEQCATNTEQEFGAKCASALKAL